jgi:predicted metal-dependent HD superfamily phosphohydrolase
MLDEEEWLDTWMSLGAAVPEALFAELNARYSEPHRFYHTLQHLGDCFRALAPAAHLAEHLAEVELALWFHDAIYDTHAQDNEEISALWAERALIAGGVGAQAAARVRELVMATKHDVIPAGGDAKLLVDVDLAILGSPKARFMEYEEQVRREYGWVPDDAFRQGRKRILMSFLDRPSIYGTPWFAERLERQARTNISGSLLALGA